MIVSIYLVRLSLIHSNMPQNEFPSTKVSEITHLSDSGDRYPAWRHTDHKAQKIVFICNFLGCYAGKRLFVRIRSQNLSWEPNKISFITRWWHLRPHLMEKVSTRARTLSCYIQCFVPSVAAWPRVSAGLPRADTADTLSSEIYVLNVSSLLSLCPRMYFRIYESFWNPHLPSKHTKTSRQQCIYYFYHPYNEYSLI